MTIRSRFGSAAAAVLTFAFAFAGCAKTDGDHATADHPAEAPAPAASTTDGPAAPDASGRVAVTVDGQGFHPDRITTHAGQPITLAVTRTTDETCGTEIVFKSLAIDKKLPLNETVEITFTPAEKGEIAFACGMDMLKGSIVVD
jgi:plastocyanin